MGVSQSDAYQMHAYAHVYGATACILLYPDLLASSGLKKIWYFQSKKTVGDERQLSELSVATIDILKEEDMVRTLLSLIDSVESEIESRESSLALD